MSALNTPTAQAASWWKGFCEMLPQRMLKLEEGSDYRYELPAVEHVHSSALSIQPLNVRNPPVRPYACT